MKSFLGRSALVIGFSAIAIGACNKNNDNRTARSPGDEPRARYERTPEEQRTAGDPRGSTRNNNNEQLDPREPRSIGGGPSENIARTTPALAVSSIATARCDRELRCKNIGPNEKYLSTSECVAKLQNDKRTDINAQDCPAVSDKALTSCLQSIRDEDCNNPLDAVSRLTACRSGNLCQK
jgi:hypothetical protein